MWAVSRGDRGIRGSGGCMYVPRPGNLARGSCLMSARRSRCAGGHSGCFLWTRGKVSASTPTFRPGRSMRNRAWGIGRARTHVPWDVGEHAADCVGLCARGRQAASTGIRLGHTSARTISGVTFFGRNRSARAAAASGDGSPPAYRHSSQDSQ